MRIKATKKTLALLAGLFVFSLLLFGTGFAMQRKSLRQSMEVLTAKEAEVEDGEMLARRYESALRRLEEDRAQLIFLESGVSDAAYVPTLLKQLEDLAIRTENRVLSVRPQVVRQGPSRMEQRRNPDASSRERAAAGGESDEPKPEPYNKLQIQVSLVGTFQTTQRLLNELTRFPKIISVDSVQLRPRAATSTSEPTASPRLDVQLTMTAFLMKEDRLRPPAVTARLPVGETQP